MQVITPVHADERLIARGVYHYYVDDDDTHIREPWTIHQQSDSAWIIRIERDAQAFKANILTEVRMAQGHITQVDIRWRNATETLVSQATAHYVFSGDVLKVSRQCDNQTFEEAHTLTDDVLVSPLMRVTTGYVLRDLVQFPKGTQILIPNIKEPDKPEKLLSAYFEHRQAKVMCTETIELDGKSYQATCYQYIGEQYDDTARFWLDERDILLKYSYQQADGKLWRVELRDYEWLQ